MALPPARIDPRSLATIVGADVAVAPAPASFLSDITAERMLKTLDASGALASGKTHMLSLTAIRDALAAAWPQRKSMVWEMAEAQIRRRIGTRGLTVRLNDEVFLVVTPELDPASAQVLAVRLVREITTHFLGELKIQDISIFVALGFRDDQLECRPLTDAELSRAVATEKIHDKGTPAETSDTPPLVSPDGVSELITQQGCRVRFSVSIAPVVDLTKFSIAGHRIEPKISSKDTQLLLSPSERRALMPRDIQDVDLAVLGRGIARLKSGQSHNDRPSLILTVSFLTLSNTRSRACLLAEIAKMREAAVKSVIFELADFDEGVPLGRLKEAVALLRPFCRSVFARCDPKAHFVQASEALGFKGMVVEPPQSNTSDQDQSAWLILASNSLGGHRGAAIAANLSATSLLPTAAAAGFTHATIKV